MTMLHNLFFALVTAIMMLSCVVVWLRAAKVSPDQRPAQIIAGICLTIAACVVIFIWIIFRG